MAAIANGQFYPGRDLEDLRDLLEIAARIELAVGDGRHSPQCVSRSFAGAQDRHRHAGVCDLLRRVEQIELVRRPAVGEQHDVTDLLLGRPERLQRLAQRRGDLGVAFGRQRIECGRQRGRIRLGIERQGPPGPRGERQDADPILIPQRLDCLEGARLGDVVVQAALALLCGANDFGGTLMEEAISRESGADHGENLPAEEMRRLIREVGRVPVERSTTYEILRRFEDPTADPSSREVGSLRELSGPARWRVHPERPGRATSSY